MVFGVIHFSFSFCFGSGDKSEFESELEIDFGFFLIVDFFVNFFVDFFVIIGRFFLLALIQSVPKKTGLYEKLNKKYN